MQGRKAELLLQGVVENDTLLSKLKLPGSILITTADPNRSGKRGRSGGWVDLKEKVITRVGRVESDLVKGEKKKENHCYNRKRESEGQRNKVRRKLQVCRKKERQQRKETERRGREVGLPSSAL